MSAFQRAIARPHSVPGGPAAARSPRDGIGHESDKRAFFALRNREREGCEPGRPGWVFGHLNGTSDRAGLLGMRRSSIGGLACPVAQKDRQNRDPPLR